MNRRELAAAIYRTAHLAGTFRLRSGAISSEYFDKYRFESEQVAESAEALRRLGAHVTDAVCVIDREAGGSKALAAAGIRLRPLFRMSELKDAAL
jgi:orotate phosphoribosyltransferase